MSARKAEARREGAASIFLTEKHGGLKEKAYLCFLKMKYVERKKIFPFLKTKYSFFILLLCTASLTHAENWLSRVPDGTYVSVLSIPGAHDAATGNGWDSAYGDLGDAFARTQELTLSQQWSLGVRAFDLRPCTRDGYLNINHGIVPANTRFHDALRLLCDSLAANPSEFAIIHLLHETDGDQVEGTYNAELLEVLQSADCTDFFVPFRKNLTVGDMRGKILLLSRDVYASQPIGGFFRNWTHEAVWAKMTQGRITGTTSSAAATLYVQDYPETFADGALQTKVDAIVQLLKFSTTHKTLSTAFIRWVFNFASAYSQVADIFGYRVSTSDGYRDNAAHTHAAILDFLSTNTAGPTGIVMMDYAGVDATAGFATRGKELVRAIVDNNFRYLDTIPAGIRPNPQEKVKVEAFFSLTGELVAKPRKGTICLVRYADGSVRKKVFN